MCKQLVLKRRVSCVANITPDQSPRWQPPRRNLLPDQLLFVKRLQEVMQRTHHLRSTSPFLILPQRTLVSRYIILKLLQTSDIVEHNNLVQLKTLSVGSTLEMWLRLLPCNSKYMPHQERMHQSPVFSHISWAMEHDSLSTTIFAASNGSLRPLLRLVQLQVRNMPSMLHHFNNAYNFWSQL